MEFINSADAHKFLIYMSKNPNWWIRLTLSSSIFDTKTYNGRKKRR